MDKPKPAAPRSVNEAYAACEELRRMGFVWDELIEAWRPATLGATACEAVAAERERCLRILEAYRVPVGNSAAGELAAEWTMDALREVRDAINKG